MTAMTTAYRAAKESRGTRQRVPLTIRAASFLGKHLPSWERARTTVMSVTGFALVDVGVWEWNHIAGLITTGVSVLVLEALSGD